MTLNDTKQLKNNRGFTIVELLIVIVIIGILAALVIVAYNGIQNRAKTTNSQTLASLVQKKSEAWNSLQSSYPTYCQIATNTLAPTGSGSGIGAAGCTAAGGNGPQEAKLDDPNDLSALAVTATTGAGAVHYAPCGSAPHTGARIHYWNYSANAITTAATTPASVTIGTGC